MPPIQPPVAFALFPTPIGTCGIAWGAHGIIALQLPESDRRATRARLLRAAPEAQPGTPPPEVLRVIADVRALLAGERRNLDSAVLDLRGVTPFRRRVYEVARTIAPGHTRSYGEVAALCGEPHAARAVGQALAHNPLPLIVPCHRVLAADGKSGGFSARGGAAMKLRLLELEGAVPAPADAAGTEERNLPLPF